MGFRVLLVFFILAVASAAPAQTTSPPNRTRVRGSKAPPLSRLSPAVRARALALLNEKDDKKRADLAEDLVESGQARAFVFYLLETDASSRVRTDIIDKLDSRPDSLRALEL